MPHSLFIGSALATQDRVAYRLAKEKERQIEADAASVTSQQKLRSCSTTFPAHFVKYVKESALTAVRVPEASSYATTAKCHAEHKNNPFGFVLAHVYHGIADVVISLLGFAVVINSLILILASAVFYYGSASARQSGGPAGLFDAYDLIRDLVGQGAATLFAIALLSAGQSASIIATIAGQAVSEGFLRWRVSPIVRRALTRLLATIPSMVVAIAVGKQGINTLLVASQVVLSMVLPFITLPLICFTSRKSIMSVRKPRPAATGITTLQTMSDMAADSNNVGQSRDAEEDLENADGELVDFSNSKITFAFGMVIWLIIVVANLYVLVELGRGGSS
ncbi:hypothetical protein AX17_000047 [Amanita inopinata Kibby_2008]|nr:hypothetical protein AX17_000047 [Amanita inopinata Kibby_2008]